MARIPIGDLALHVEERGDGEPLLLILTGDDDQVIPAASSDVLHERIPDSRLEVIAGTGHLFFLERPESSLELIEAFLAPAGH